MLNTCRYNDPAWNIKAILNDLWEYISQTLHIYDGQYASLVSPVGQLSVRLEMFIMMQDHHIKDSPAKYYTHLQLPQGNKTRHIITCKFQIPQALIWDLVPHLLSL